MADHAQPWARGARLRPPPALGAVAALVAWGAVWIALWRLASILAVNFGISAWYPPAAISLFVLIRYGPAAAPAIVAASLLAGSGQWHGYPGHHEILGSLGHAAAYLAAATLYRRRLDRHRRSIRPESLRALGAAALLGATLASLLGNANIHLAAGEAYEVTFDRVFAWLTGDLFGIVSLCPFLLFLAPRAGQTRPTWRRLAARLAAPLAALAAAVAVAAGFAVISDGSALDFRVVAVVGVGVLSVIVAHVASPRSAVIYLSLVAIIAAGWLSTEVAPAARVEFAVQICTFLIAAYAMICLSMEKMRARAAAMTRRLRIRALAEQRDALSRRVGAIEAEFAQLAHEFKTPLGGLIGLLELTEGGVASGRGREQVAQYFRFMRGCAQYLRTLVDDAFDVARIGRGRFEAATETFDVADLLEDLALIARSKGGGAVSFPDDLAALRPRVRSDRNRLMQILVNLLVNAVRYADREGSVRVECAVSADTVTISVRNACAAMTKAQLDAALAGDPGVAGDPRGLGIGLPLVGRLAAGVGVRLATTVADGVVTVSVAAPRA